MAKRSIQGYVELASGLGELTRSRAKEAAQEILSLAGSDASRKKAAKQVSDLADELLHAAQSNRKHLVRLVRREVESALGKLDVNRLSGDVQTLAATVAGLATQVDDMARSATGLNTRTPGPVADALADLEPEPARVAARSSAPARKAPAKKTTAKKTTAKKTTAKKTTAKKTTAKSTAKSTASKSTARKAPAKTSPAKTSSARKAPARKAPATTTSAATKAAATKAPARKAPARKSTATTATRATSATAKTAATSSTPAATSTTPAAGA